jgi:hypothetical protein
MDTSPSLSAFLESACLPRFRTPVLESAREGTEEEEVVVVVAVVAVVVEAEGVVVVVEDVEEAEEEEVMADDSMEKVVDDEVEKEVVGRALVLATRGAGDRGTASKPLDAVDCAVDEEAVAEREEGSASVLARPCELTAERDNRAEAGAHTEAERGGALERSS